MAHFAKLDSNNIVTQVIVVADSDSGGGTLASEATGIAFCRNHVGDNSSIWKQTSYNMNFRGSYAGIGYTYMTGVRTLGVASTDIFIGQGPPADCPSWGIGVTTPQWESPIGEPPTLTSQQMTDNKVYVWDEAAYQGNNTVGWALSVLSK